MTFEREKQTAIAAVTQAAQLCQAVRSKIAVDAMQKDDRSPVTIADFGSQALVCRTVREAFPHDPIVGEEDAAELRKPENTMMLDQVMSYVHPLQSDATSDAVCDWIDAGNGKVAQRFWTLDPIDGTKGFLRNDQYAIALALIVDGQVQVGVLACPSLPIHMKQPNGATGVIFVAVRGQGAAMAAFDNTAFTSIHVAQPSDVDRLRFVESVEAAHGHSTLQEAVAHTAGVTQPALRMDSQAKYGVVARGDAVLYLRLPSPKTPDYREKIWDHAAGALIVQEAGGRVTDMHGKPLDLASDYKMNENRGVIASNGVVHEAALAALAEV